MGNRRHGARRRACSANVPSGTGACAHGPWRAALDDCTHRATPRTTSEPSQAASEKRGNLEHCNEAAGTSDRPASEPAPMRTRSTSMEDGLGYCGCVATAMELRGNGKPRLHRHAKPWAGGTARPPEDWAETGGVRWNLCPKCPHISQFRAKTHNIGHPGLGIDAIRAGFGQFQRNPARTRLSLCRLRPCCTEPGQVRTNLAHRLRQMRPGFRAKRGPSWSDLGHRTQRISAKLGTENRPLG